MCSGGILPDPVSQPTNKVWQAVAPASFSAHCVSICDRTIILCPPGWQDSHRDSHQRHAAVWQHLPVACWRTCLRTSSLSINLDSLCHPISNIMSSHVTEIILIKNTKQPYEGTSYHIYEKISLNRNFLNIC